MVLGLEFFSLKRKLRALLTEAPQFSEAEKSKHSFCALVSLIVSISF